VKRVVNARNKNVVVEELEWADSMATRLVGLMGRRELPSGRGLWITRSGNSIHTCFMRFPIDVLFVAKNGLVKHAVKNIKPWRLVVAPLLMPTDCLELPAGTIEKTQTVVGDVLSVEA
jgi:uncharacterized protein